MIDLAASSSTGTPGKTPGRSSFGGFALTGCARKRAKREDAVYAAYKDGRLQFADPENRLPGAKLHLGSLEADDPAAVPLAAAASQLRTLHELAGIKAEGLP